MGSHGRVSPKSEPLQFAFLLIKYLTRAIIGLSRSKLEKVAMLCEPFSLFPFRHLPFVGMG
jgi:hypothetical protein